MTTTNPPTTVGAYLRDLPPDRRVAMARVCSMIRRSARGVRESMRYGLAFYELDGPLFALESGRKHMSLFVAEQDVVVKHKDALAGVDPKRSFIRFNDLNRLPLDVVEKIVRDSVVARRSRVSAGTVPTQADLLKLWGIKEEKVEAPMAVTLALVAAAKTPAKVASALKSAVASSVIARVGVKTADKPAAKAAAKPASAKPPAKVAAKATTKPAAKTSAAPRRGK